MSYGGPAIMGIMQTKIQEKRHWIEKQEFVDLVMAADTVAGYKLRHFTQLGKILTKDSPRNGRQWSSRS
jgi:hypothetical protein